MRNLLICTLLCIASGLAGAADRAAGAAKAAACVACHGTGGVSQMVDTPSLAGQPDGFLQWQLVYFRGGRRKNPVMQPMAADLSDDDIRNLAAHFASLPPPQAGNQGAADPELFASGRKIAQQHRCAACHQESYAGAQAAARTAQQREDYLLKALRDFKSGARIGNGVASMGDAVYPLVDDQLRALAHFMSHLP